MHTVELSSARGGHKYVFRVTVPEQEEEGRPTLFIRAEDLGSLDLHLVEVRSDVWEVLYGTDYSKNIAVGDRGQLMDLVARQYLWDSEEGVEAEQCREDVEFFKVVLVHFLPTVVKVVGNLRDTAMRGR